MTESPVPIPRLKAAGDGGPPGPAPWLSALLLQGGVVLATFVMQLVVALIAVTKGYFLFDHIPPWLTTAVPAIVFFGGVILGFRLHGVSPSRLVRLLTGVPFAVCAICVLAALSLLGTLLPSKLAENPWAIAAGLADFYASAPYVAAVLLVLLSLTTALGTRLAHPRPGLTGFLLAHLGLALILVGAMAGKAYYVQGGIELSEGIPVSALTDFKGVSHNLNGAVTLDHFSVETYPAHLYLQRIGMQMMVEEQVVDSEWLTPGRRFLADGVSIDVLEVTPNVNVDEQGHAQAPIIEGAHVRLTVPGKDPIEGDVSAGSDHFHMTPERAVAPPRYVVGMTEPEEKAFRSALRLAPNGGQETSVAVEMNRPVYMNGWGFYQSGFDVVDGKYTSTLLAVRDPALPVVYVGFIALALGTFLVLWLKPRRRTSVAASKAAEGARMSTLSPFTTAALIALFCWGVAFIAYLPAMTRRVRFPLGTVALVLGWVAVAVYTGWLWYALQRIPMRTMGETWLWFAFFLPVIGLLVEWRWRTTTHRYPLLILAVGAVFMLLMMAERMDRTQAPLLNSPWFAPHVLVFLLSYAALGIAALVAGYLLIRSWTGRAEILVSGAQEVRRFIYIAFPLMTLGNVLGALWAQMAWGAYWSWDVKETMALVTWLIYLAYLHADMHRSLRPRQHLVFAVLGFLSLLLCWLGVKFLPAAAGSLHVYGG